MKTAILYYILMCLYCAHLFALPDLPCPNEIERESDVLVQFCYDEDCPAEHRNVHGSDITLELTRTPEEWWKIPDRKFWSISSNTILHFEGEEWLLLYPHKNNVWEPKKTRIEVKRKPVVKKMKDGWYKITFEADD
jgi:hypothetical protein